MNKVLAASLLALFGGGLFAASLRPNVSGPPRSAKAPAPPRIGGALLASIREAASRGWIWDLGLTDASGGSLRLSIYSGRGLTASKISSAALSGGRYAPKSIVDTVDIYCGSGYTFETRFECARVSVRATDGRKVRPLSYSARTKVYTNALGAKWRVREVAAHYSVGPLANGFSVDYAGTDETEWTFEVSAEDAAEKLLLKLEPK